VLRNTDGGVALHIFLCVKEPESIPCREAKSL
jgi:hypothetical protein